MTSLADACVDARSLGPEMLLDRLCRELSASHAAIWVLEGAHAWLVLSTSAPAKSDATATRTVRPALTELLYAHRAVVSHSGRRQPGLDVFAPAGARSFVVASSIAGQKVTSVLVVGWPDDVPPCEERDLLMLCTAGALFERSLSVQRVSQETSHLSDAIFASLRDPIAALDRRGVVIAVNPAWENGHHSHVPGSTVVAAPGLNYIQACWQAAEAGSPEASHLAEGLSAVCVGVLESFVSSYARYDAGEERWYTITATALHHELGGAIVTHVQIPREDVRVLAGRIGDEQFHRLADTLPLPVWMASPDGTLTYANRLWLEANGGAGTRPLGGRDWTQGFHPGDRKPARAAFRNAVQNRKPFDLELRLTRADATSRWFACVGSPRLSADGLEGFIGFCYDITSRVEAEAALSGVAAKLVSAQEGERSRIARELHDDVGQQVALLASRMEVLLGDHHTPRNRGHALLLEARRNLHDIASSLHALSHRLHPAKLRLLGLIPTLESLCRDVAEEGHLQIRFTASGVADHVDDGLALCVYRVAQEALQNAVKHSGAATIDVHVEGTLDRLRLRVHDSGIGFAPRLSASSGIGLVTMRERVELVGGTFDISSSTGSGTTVSAELPIFPGPSSHATT